METKELIEQLLSSGPIGIVAVVFFYLYLRTDKKLEDERQVILDLVKASIEADNAVKVALNSVQETFKTAMQMIQSRPPGSGGT